MHTSWLEISEPNLKQNISFLRKFCTNPLENGSGTSTRFGAVLKANAYGHGLFEVFDAVYEIVDMILLICPEEAIKLKKYATIKGYKCPRILVIGWTINSHLADIVAAGIEFVVSATAHFQILDSMLIAANNTPIEQSKRAKIHVHLDTGLSREGFLWSEKDELLLHLIKYSGIISLEGFMSHFANVEDVTNQKFALEQNQNLVNFVDFINTQVPLTSENRFVHIAASAATLILPESRHQLVRSGISIYGYWPSSETKLSLKILNHSESQGLRPALEWKVLSQVIKTIPKGSYIGYGCTYLCESDTKIALLPVGYYDGYPRLLSDKAYVLIKGKRCKVLGRIMMNHIVIDITNIADVTFPCEAVLIGWSENEFLSAETLAQWSHSIVYEILARIGSHLERKVIRLPKIGE